MDVHTSSEQQLHKTDFYAFDEYEYDDDVFYKELRRQVFQLTAEDDHDDDYESYENKNPNMLPKQGQNYGATDGWGYYNWPANTEDHAAPSWILNLWRTGNGTGVFIPQINAQTRPKNRPRKKNRGGRTHKGVRKVELD